MGITAPIFVVGLNKSGTSLLNLLLARHHDLSGLRYDPDRQEQVKAAKKAAKKAIEEPAKLPISKYGLRRFYRLLSRPRKPSSQSTDRTTRKKRGVANLYLRDFGLSEGQKIEGLPVKLAASVAPYLFGNPHYIDCYRLTEADVEPGDLEAVVRSWQSAMIKPGYRLIEKSPPNMVRTRYLQALFPDATFIVNVRDPYANISANAKRRTRWGTVADQTLHWMNAHRIVLDDMERLQRVKIVHYEDWVGDTEASLKAICDFCHLPWDKAMLEAIAIEPNMNDELIADLSPDDTESITELLDARILSTFGYGIRLA
jgi:hypothetical protein